MCGIAGIYRPERSGGEEDLSRVRTMNARLAHRGPDDAGDFAAPGVALAMRRLSIIDLPGGRQPIFNEDRSVVVVLNGEIYNFRALRAGLEKSGHRFATGTDTEVLVHLYEEKGVRLLEDLSGMFAFALYDAKHHRLLLARDPSGQKPFYYEMPADGSLCFASELKALDAAGEPRTLDPDAISLYLSHLAIPSPRTIWKEVRRLAPGEAMTCGPSGYRRWRYDRPEVELDAEPLEGTLDRLEEDLRPRLADAIRSHLTADVPRGAFLSGGLDSTMVVLLMKETLQEDIRTFSVSFDDPSYDETPQVEATVRELGLRHTKIPCPAPGHGTLDRMIELFDEPFGDPSAIPTEVLCAAASREVKVALTGDGGDEVFGGYPTYQAPYWADAYAKIPAPLRALVAAGAARLPASFDRIPLEYRLKRMASSGDLRGPARHLHWMDPFPPAEKAKLFLGAPDLLPAHTVLERPWREARKTNPVRRLAHLDQSVYLPDRVLVKTDRCSMAHGLEVRAPLLDRELVAWARRLPANALVSPFSTKVLFRRAVARRLPSLVAKMPKKGFAPPIGRWLRTTLRTEVEATLLDPSVRSRGLRREEIARLWRAHQTGAADHGRALWALAMLIRFIVSH